MESQGPAGAPVGAPVRVALRTVLLEWGRIGCLGFGGPPAHIAMLRRLCVTGRAWLTEEEFADGVAAVNLLPGPASTQLAIWCAWRLRGPAGAITGGLAFIVPGLVMILGLAAVFLGSPPVWVRAASAGAGSAVAAVAVHAAVGLVPASWRRATQTPQAAGRPGSAAGGASRVARFAERVPGAVTVALAGGWEPRRWLLYVLAGVSAGVFAGPYLVLVLVAAGLFEVLTRVPRPPTAPGSGGSYRAAGTLPLGSAALWWSRRPGRVVSAAASAVGGSGGGLGAVAWVALKVGLLSYGGGFVIIPLMQADAVERYHWLTAGQFLNAVALGQVTPGPVVLTVAVIGYGAAGVPGGLLAAGVAFAPSFVMVLAGGRSFDRVRTDLRVQAFLTGAAPAVIGAIAGSAVPLAAALAQPWQFAVLAAGLVWLVGLRRQVTTALLGAALLGLAALAVGLPV